MKPITDVLREIRKGRVVTDATEKLQRVVESVIDTKKSGSLTLEISIRPQKNDDEQVIIACKVKAKCPEQDLPEAVFFVDDEFNLVRDDPRQREMFDGGDEVGQRRRASAGGEGAPAS